MTKPIAPKVSIRLEILIDGEEITTRLPEPKTKDHERYRRITRPMNGGDTPVVVINGINHIAANGESPMQGENYPRQVKARAYPDVNAIPTFNPPGNAVTGILLNNGADWRFTQADGNLIPEAKCDAISNGPANSLLAIWYEYASGAQSLETTPFHGYCPPQSSAPIPPMNCCPGSTTLFANFTGSLSPLGSVKLSWNGLSWTATEPKHGLILTLSSVGGVYQLQGAGRGSAFILAGTPVTAKPLVLSARGNSVGDLLGDFTVTVTE